MNWKGPKRIIKAQLFKSVEFDFDLLVRSESFWIILNCRYILKLMLICGFVLM